MASGCMEKSDEHPLGIGVPQYTAMGKRREVYKPAGQFR